MLENVIEILLAEDNPSDVRLTLHALNRYNLTNKIHVVRDGAGGLRLPLLYRGVRAAQHRATPQGDWLDLKLPLVNGLEVLQRMKADPRTRLIPVVILTSSREERDIVDSYQLGVNSYITKPVDFEQFTEAVRALGMYWVLLNQAPILTG